MPMRHTFSIIARVMICLSLTMPSMDAFAAPDNNRQGRRPATSQSDSRGKKDKKHDGNRGHQGNNRPGSQPSKPSRPNQPSQPNKPNRPGKPGNSGRPNHPGKPTQPAQPSRPNNPVRPGRPVQPARPSHPNPVRPGVSHRPPVMPPPHRPARPVAHTHWHRPVAPATWRPYRGCPSFSTALGIAFGTAIMSSIDMLLNNGYTVDGYNANQIYLRNVNQLNYMWPDATLYYNNGGLAGSAYIYSTPGYNTARYYSVYNNLVGLYGQPVTVLSPSQGLGATWFGNNGAFVTLNYSQGASADGSLRYFTTLSFGN